MSEASSRSDSTFTRIEHLVRDGDYKLSAHGIEELIADGIIFADVLASLSSAVVVEDYPDHPRGQCVLVLQKDACGSPLHVLWGIPKNRPSLAVLVTAYRPDPARWSNDFRERKP
jgi:hypothetical protein